jgi:chemotaxis family two-component system response regulator Rcp1
VNRSIDILLVEDNEADADLTREGLDDSKILNRLFVVKNGIEAMSFLRREEPFADAPRPDIILLDLNLPRKDGREVLADIKSDPDLAAIPVVILTSSKAEKDIAMSYQQHANAYVTKPVGLAGFAQIVKAIDAFWFTVVVLPPKEGEI